MAVDGFARAYARIRVHEGGKVDDHRDPGGRTNAGVTQRTYNGDRRARGLPVRDVWLASEDEIQAIYRAGYWAKIDGDALPEGVDYLVFDGAINSGAAQSIKWLQRALGVPHVDGVIGHETRGALADCDPVALVDAICARRLAFDKALHTWSTFGRGWTHRIDEVKVVAAVWAAQGETDHQPTYLAGMERKAVIADHRPIPSPAVADAATGGGASAMGLSGLQDKLTDLQDKLTPWTDKVDFLKYVIPALIILGGAAMLAGLAYGLWVRRRRAALHDALDLAPMQPMAPLATPPAVADDPPPPSPAVVAAVPAVASAPAAGGAS